MGKQQWEYDEIILR